MTIPTLSSLYTSIVGDIQSQYGSNIPAFARVMLRALALVQAAKLKIYYLAIASVQKNIFVDTADPVSIGGTLERFGFIKLGRYPNPAVAGQYNLTVTGTIASVIPRNTTFKSNDDSINPGYLFIVDNSYTMPSATGTVLVRALTAGDESKMAIGDALTLTAPIAGVDSTAVVLSEVIQPLAAETTEEYRTKALQAYRLEPQGGAGSDYRIWAADAAGAKVVYPYAKSGAANEINLYVEANLVDSTDGKGTPTVTIINAVKSVVEFDPDTTKALTERGRRPLGIFQVNYLAVTIRTVQVSVTGFVGLTPAIQTLISDGLKEAVDRIRPFVASADVLDNKNDILDVNIIISTILLTRPGSSFGAVSFTVDGVPYSTFNFLNGDIPFFNGVTWL